LGKSQGLRNAQRSEGLQAKDSRGEKFTITLEKNLDYMLGLKSETEASGWDFDQGRGGGGRGG